MNRHPRLVVGIALIAVLWSSFVYSQPQISETVATHIQELKHARADIRSFAASNLATLGAQAAPAVPALIETLNDQEPSVRSASAKALGSIGNAANSAETALMELLTRDDLEYVRGSALEALAKIAPQVVTNVPNLIVGLKSPDKGRRRWSAEALVQLEDNAKPALAELTAALKDEVPAVRIAAAEALRNVRESARPAVGALLGALQDDNEKVRRNAAQALEWIGPGAEDAVPHLMKAMSDSDPFVRSNAARALTTAWPGEERAIPTLIKGLDDEDQTSHVKSDTGYALRSLALRGHDQVVIPALVEYLKKPNQTGELTVIKSLREIGPKAKSAIPALEKRLKSADANLRGAAAEAIALISGSSDAGVKSLIADLRSRDYSVREAAIISIGKVGPAASAAVPDLVSMLEDRNERAFTAYKQAAENGVAEAQFELALLLRDGVGTAADINVAVTWLRKAAAQGHRKAQRQLGILFHEGRGVAQDDVRAEKFYREAARPGGALARMKSATVIQAAYEQALKPHQTGKPAHYAAQQKMILLVTTFNEDAGVAYHHQVLADGTIDAYRDVFEWAIQGGGSPHQLGQLELQRLDALARKLPRGAESAPLQRRIIISCRVGQHWTTHHYDSEYLPAVVRQVLDVVDASVDTAPLPPQDRWSWLAKRQPATGLVFRSDGTLLSWGNERKLYHWKDGQIGDDIGRDPLHARPFAASADRIATDELHHLKLWDVKSGAQVADLGENTDRGDSLTRGTFSADGRTLAIQQYAHHRIHIWDAVAGKLRGEIPVGGFFSPSIAVSADGQQLALSCADKFIRIWNLTTLKLQQEIASEETRGLAFSPDGKHLAAVEGYHLMLWDLGTGKTRFQAHIDSWTGLPCFTPDSATIVCKVGNRKIRLWDARDGRVIGIAEGHLLEITALTISPDGKHIASSSTDGFIKVWNIEQLTGSK